MSKLTKTKGTITYDKEASALYIKLTNKKIKGTIPLNETTIIDIDKKGIVVGIEIIGLPTNFQLKK